MTDKIEGVSGLTTIEPWHITTTLMSFSKDGQAGEFDIVDGKFDYRGELPITDAARMLFETIAANCGEWWVERAIMKTADAPASP